MSVSSVNNPLASALRNVGRPLHNGTTPAGVQPGARPTAPAALRPAQPLAAPQQSLQAEAPAGTDPALWSVLTGEERAFFAKAAASGPLTYRRISAGVNALQGGLPAAAPGVARGARLDIRA